MSGHTRWANVHPLPDRRLLEVQLAYVDGYILALEDAFKDLAQIPLPIAGEGLLREYRRTIRRVLAGSLDSARLTRKLMQVHYEGKVDGATNEAGLGEDVPGDLGGLPG